MNNENLKSYTKGSIRAKINGKIGGYNSGESKRSKKAITDVLRDILDSVATDKESVELLQEFERKKGDRATVLALRLYKSAIYGNIRAVKLIVELLGEIEKAKVIVKNTVENIEENEIYNKGFHAGTSAIFKNMTDKELYTLIERIEKGVEIPADEKPCITPDGRVICGASMLED